MVSNVRQYFPLHHSSKSNPEAIIVLQPCDFLFFSKWFVGMRYLYLKDISYDGGVFVCEVYLLKKFFWWYFKEIEISYFGNE